MNLHQIVRVACHAKSANSRRRAVGRLDRHGAIEHLVQVLDESRYRDSREEAEVLLNKYASK